MAKPTTDTSRTGRIPRWIWRVLSIPLLVYLGLVLILYWMQAKLIFAGSARQGQPSANLRPGAHTEVLRLKSPDGTTVVAMFGVALNDQGEPVEDSRSHPTLIYFYGNGMCLADANWEFDQFRRHGFNVLIPEYLGYGLSGGTPSEAGCYTTADVACDALLARPEIDPQTIIAAGTSLGGGVAVDLAARRMIAGVALFSTFTSLTEVAQRIYPIFPVSALLVHRFSSERKLANINVPLFLAHGRRDQLIPFEMADRLARAARGPVTRLTSDTADHNDLFQEEATRLFPALRDWSRGLRRSAATSGPR